MDELVAPIALYPDSMVAQILLCATSPYQVRQVNAWLKERISRAAPSRRPR
jgi:hypothetical protein